MKNKPPSIRFYFENAKPPLKDRKRLKAFLSSLFSASTLTLRELSYVFTTDERLLQINQEFLNHDTYTDIITFDLSDSNQAISGEVYISWDRVQENALHHNASTIEELHRVIFHGALHLCGMKDKSASEKKAMRLAENQCLNDYFDVPRGTN